MADAPRDSNRIPSTLAVSNVNGTTPVVLWANPATHELLVTGSLTVSGGSTEIVDAGGNIVGVTSNALDVNIKSGAAAGEQYADNTAVSAAYKGNLVLGTDGSNYQILSVSAAGVLNVAGAVTATNSTAANLKVEATIAATQTLATLTTITNDVGIKDNGNSITVDGTVTANISGSISNTSFVATQGTASNLKVEATLAAAQTLATLTTITNDVGIKDNGNSITIDGAVTNTVLSVVGNGAAATAQRVTLANDSTGIVALTTSTASIGKLAANNGVDIGDVDVTSLPKSIQGPGIPNVDSYAHAVISAAANTADQSLVAAPGDNKQIWVYGISYVVGTAAGSVSFQDEDNTAISGVMPHALNSGQGIPPSGNFSMPIWKVATNKALEVDTVTCDIKGWIDFAIVSV